VQPLLRGLLHRYRVRQTQTRCDFLRRSVEQPVVRLLDQVDQLPMNIVELEVRRKEPRPLFINAPAAGAEI
jgi:hypothetical protein